MGPNRRAQERERAAARAAAEAKRAEAERKATADAQKIVAIWNARQARGRELWFHPTIGAAITAGLPWLTYSCPAVPAARCGRPANPRSAPRRLDLKPDPIHLVPAVLAERPVCQARNADG
jgi:hypothetical protein